MSHVKTVLVNHPGPLPISVQYTPTADVSEAIWFCGSVRTGDLASKPIGFELKVNGESVGKSLICTQDTNNAHKATVPTMVSYDIPFVVKDGKVQPVMIELVGTWDAYATEEDFFNVSIFE